MKSDMLITICARGGSKGIPGKNIKLLNGLPLIAYSIRTAQAFATLNDADLSLSTDDLKIKEVAAEYELKTSYTRPEKLASDTAGKIDAIRDLLEFEEASRKKRYDLILDLDATSPLRTVEDLVVALKLLEGNETALNIFSVNLANRNPYFNMVEEKENGFVGLVKSNARIKSRQQAPQVYDMNASFYFFRRKFFEEGHETSVTDRSLAYIMPHICFDLDEPHDFTIMEIMLREKLLGFDL